ncbi:hypothetical protein [Winogradskyella vincentii]|uniref:TonB family C-terminal domain-containing protein n=1 Tax=Winogradskyella vincentii TaxID=2877122 RepID=A0ABS7XXR3_9FLAO|nr:hypothetical protein [Winogradskyella vincentii]MCA0152151.1 hypothetical protein [Winogradskyella vincentii]
MNLIDKHKAAIITFLLSGIVVLSLFTIQLKQKGSLISESFYKIEPETEEEKLIEEFEKLKGPSTNKAFNEDQEFKEMMRNFKTLASNDFQRTTKELDNTDNTKDLIEERNINKSINDNNAYALNNAETDSYKALQEKLNKRLKNQKIADEHANRRSTLTYSLKGRTLGYYQIPRYLCERGGKIVVSIRVDEKGNVFDAYINGSSNSKNQCLIDHAIDYAKSVQFDASDRTDQLGTITFLFKGKN